MLPARNERHLYLIKAANSVFENIGEDELEIVVSIDEKNISLRDFSAFLLLIDHFYGRNFQKGFQSYSMTKDVHLKASEIRVGSVEIIIEEILKYLPVKQAVLVFLLIKYLPSAIKSISESLLNTSEAFYNFEKTRLVRRMRKNLRRHLREDEILQSLSDEEISKLAEDLQKKYELDRRHIYKAGRFAADKMKSIKVRKRKK